MHIGYMRYSLPIELNLAKGSISTLGTEIRSGLLYSLTQKLGHKVTILSEVVSRDIPLMESMSFSNSWLNNIDYRPFANNPDIDVLILECGPTNTKFGSGGGKYQVISGLDSVGQIQVVKDEKLLDIEHSNIGNIFQVLNNFSGNVIYYQHSPPLGDFNFPFGELYNMDLPFEGISVINYRSIGRWCDVFRNKRWLILHHCQNEELFKKVALVRGGKSYEDFERSHGLRMKYIPIGYSDIDPWYNPKNETNWDTMWIGGSGNSSAGNVNKHQKRVEEVLGYYDTDMYRSAVIGKWEDPRIFKFAKHLGRIGSHGDAYGFWNDSRFLVFVDTKFGSSLGFLPSRIIMAMRSGAIVLVDSSLFGAEKLFDPKYITNSKQDVLKWLNYVNSFPVEQRGKEVDKIRQEQLSRFPKWQDIDWESILKGNWS